MTKEQMVKLAKAEDLASEAATLINEVADELNETSGVDVRVEPALDDAYDGAYGAAVALGNLRIDLTKTS